VDYYPYGAEQDYTATCGTNYKFTGYERDAETGLDYAFARYYNSRLGRFMSGDPLGSSADISDPQTLNRYAYVRNNPVNLVDPTGLYTYSCLVGTDDQGNPIVGICQIVVLSASKYCDFDEFSDPADCYPDLLAGSGDSFYYPGAYGSGGGVNGSGDGGNGGGGTTPPPQSTGFTLGVRQPGQTFSACMAANSGNYSIAGVSNIQNSGGQFVLGNDVANLLFGNTSEGTAGLLVSEGGSRAFTAGVGTAMTAGRRTASITSLNLEGIPGRAPMILGKTGAEEIAGWLSGLAEIKAAIDVGLTGAEAIGCAIHQ
jgi:RHS repeat-associated protein